MQIIQLGKPFPDKRYITSQDCVVPRITPDAFDIMITLNGLTDSEYKAISEEPFRIGIFVVANIPHIIVRFIDGNTFDFALNMFLVHSIPLSEWFKNENNTVAIYILEPGTGNVKCIRYFDMTLMSELKRMLTFQFDITKEDVAALIQYGERMYSTQTMFEEAQYTETITAAKISL